MKSYRRLGWSNTRVAACLIMFGFALFTGATAQAAPQYDLICSECHQMPPLDSANGSRDPFTGAFKGSHQSHAGATAVTCVKCHGTELTSTGHRDKTIQVQGNINASPATGAYSQVFHNQTSIPFNPLGTCSNVNCHFESKTPEWGNPSGILIDCSTCHLALPTTKSHPAHTEQYGGVNACSNCHTNHTTFNHATSAGKRPIDVAGTGYAGSNSNYLPSQSGSRVVGSCSTAACHANPYGSGLIPTPLWGTASGCDACHLGTPGIFQASGAPATGSHDKHLAISGALCNQCHAGTVKNSAGGTDHADGKIDVTNGYPLNVVKHAPGSYGTCSAASCHSNPYGTGMVTTPVWGITAGCTACHNNTDTNNTGMFTGDGAPATGSHAAHMALVGATCAKCHDGAVKGSNGGSSHANGTVEVANDYIGSPVVKHTSGTYTGYCASASCHSSPYGPAAVNSPVWGATTGCASCHTGDGAFSGNGAPATGSHSKHLVLNSSGCAQCHDGATNGVSGGNSHANGTVEVLNGYASPVSKHPIGTYSGTCTTTTCHSDGNGKQIASPKWGVPMPANCSGCHGGDATVTPASAPISTGRHKPHMNNYSTLGRGNNFVCAECHAKTVSSGSNTTITNSANHLNNFKDYSGVKAGGSDNYVTATGVCSTVYCHSSGQATPVYRNMTGSKAWGSSAKFNCNGCHGNEADAAWISTFGAPNYANKSDGTLATANSHQKHTVETGVVDSRGCVKCHATTVDQSVADKMRNYSSAHLNKVRDVAFDITFAGYSGAYKDVSKTCSTYCHSNVQTPGGNGPATTYSKPSWGSNGTMNCASCHNDMAGLSEPNGLASPDLSFGSHKRHAVDAAYDCSVCHGAGNSATLFNAATHADGLINLAFTGKAAGVTYSQAGNNIPGDGYGTCSTSKCHGRATRNWGLNTLAPTCEKCHGSANTAQANGEFKDTAGNPTSKYAGTHVSHLAGTHEISSPVTCDQCHVVPNSINSFGHMSSLPARLTFGSLATHDSYPTSNTNRTMVPAYSVVTDGGTTTRSCSNTYCHAGVRNVDNSPSGALPTPSWGQGVYMSCDKCHGYPPAAPHIQKTNCSGCHSHVNETNTAFVNKAKHIDGTVDVTVDACLACHSSTNACLPGDQTCFNMPLLGAHARHTDAELFLTGKSMSAGDYIDPTWIYGIRYKNGFPKYACGFCHPMNSSTHRSKIEIDLDPSHSLVGTVKTRNKVGGPWVDAASFVSTTNVTCNNVYCHSNGFISETTNAYAYKETPNWYTNDPWNGLDKCAQCHGNSPNSGGLAGSSAHPKHVVGTHYKDVFSGYSAKFVAVGAAGSGAAHGDPATSTVLNCNVCHANTVNVAYNDKGTACSPCHNSSGSGGVKGIMNVYSSSFSAHINGVVDVAFPEPFVLKSRAQLRSDINSVPSVAASWTRVKGYKTYSSYDLAKNKPAYSLGTCSTTACHNNTQMEWRTQGPLACAACHTGLPQ
ncbi:MAG: CxxxxCH/CxxCH domain c-type cytochrome [Desulfuromonadaceae bacterium]